jgi:hypothetical protein
MTTQLKTKGSSLDTRLRHSMLLDAKLQRRLTADEFRAWINLNVWVVSLVSDGAFRTDDAEMIANLTLDHLVAFLSLGLVERDDEGNYRIHSDYWSWQSSIADLHKLEKQREANRERQEAWRNRAKGGDEVVNW